MALSRTLPRIALFGVLSALSILGDPPAVQGALPVQTVLVPATADEAIATIHLSGIDQPQPQELQVTVPSSDEQIAPTVTITGVTGAAKDWDVALKAEHLITFGE